MARTSTYAKFLDPVSLPMPGIPGFVLGGQFGDISKNIIQEDQARTQLENSQLQAEFMQQRNDELQRAEESRADLAERYANKKPLTIQEAYQQAQDVSLAHGQTDDFLKLQQAQLQRDDLERNRKLEAMRQFPFLAQAGFGQDAIDYATEAGVNVPDNALEINRRQIALPRGGRAYMNPDGTLDVFQQSEAKSSGSGGSAKGSILTKELVDADGNSTLVNTKAEYADAMAQGYRPKEKVDPLAAALAGLAGPPPKSPLTDTKAAVEDTVEGNKPKNEVDPLEGQRRSKIVNGVRVDFIRRGGKWDPV